MSEPKTAVHDYLREFYDLSPDDLAEEPRLRTYMDSIDFLDFIEFLEDEFDIDIEPFERTPKHFETVGDVVKLIARKRE